MGRRTYHYYSRQPFLQPHAPFMLSILPIMPGAPRAPLFPLGQTNLICCFSSAPASTSNTPLQLSLLPFASDTPPINAINNHVMSRETSLMASAHGHLNNEVMNNNRPPAPKFRKWLMRNNKSSLSGLILCRHIRRLPRTLYFSAFHYYCITTHVKGKFPSTLFRKLIGIFNK